MTWQFRCLSPGQWVRLAPTRRTSTPICTDKRTRSTRGSLPLFFFTRVFNPLCRPIWGSLGSHPPRRRCAPPSTLDIPATLQNALLIPMHFLSCMAALRCRGRPSRYAPASRSTTTPSFGRRSARIMRSRPAARCCSPRQLRAERKAAKGSRRYVPRSELNAAAGRSGTAGCRR